MDALQEQKIEVLEVDVEEIKQNLEIIGANKVYEDTKIVTTSNPNSNVSINRVSYELGKVGFNIDTYPLLPSFLEIDVEFLEEEGYRIDELLGRLGLSNHQIVVMKAEDIHRFYGIDYFEAYKTDSLQENNSEPSKGSSK